MGEFRTSDWEGHPWIAHCPVTFLHIHRCAARPCNPLRKQNHHCKIISRWFTPLACGPGSPESSKSYMDMASNYYLHLHLHLLHGLDEGLWG